MASDAESTESASLPKAGDVPDSSVQAQIPEESVHTHVQSSATPPHRPMDEGNKTNDTPGDLPQLQPPHMVTPPQTIQQRTPPQMVHQMTPPHPMTPPGHQMTPPNHQMAGSAHQMTPPGHQMTPPSHQMTPPTHPLTPPNHAIQRQRSPAPLQKQSPSPPQSMHQKLASPPPVIMSPPTKPSPGGGHFMNHRPMVPVTMHQVMAPNQGGPQSQEKKIQVAATKPSDMPETLSKEATPPPPLIMNDKMSVPPPSVPVAIPTVTMPPQMTTPPPTIKEATPEPRIVQQSNRSPAPSANVSAVPISNNSNMGKC